VKSVRRTRHRITQHDEIWRWLTLGPAVLLFAGLTVLPIVNLAIMSVHDITWSGGLIQWTWVGTAHLQQMTKDTLFRAGIGNTVLFACVGVVCQLFLGFALALLTSRVSRIQVAYRTAFLLPILVPGIVIGAMWKLMFNFDFGVINQALGVVGMPAIDWLGNQSTALASVIAVDVWHWTPFCFLLLLAGLESLPPDVHDAVRLDGASWWQELRWVTVPLMMPTILVTLVFRLIVAFKVFDEVFLLTGGGPGTATEVVSFTIYRRFFTEDRMGYGAMLSIVTLFAIALMIVAAMGVARGRRAGA
jgi:multiple sugar transport system permease protein